MSKKTTLPQAVEVPIKDIKPNPNNPRIIKDDKFKKLVQSIKNFPDMLRLRPIVVNAAMVVLGGNMRLRAAKDAGMKTLPIIIADQLTEAQQREFVIKDNSNFGEWDFDQLANEFDADQLNAWGLDLPDLETDTGANDEPPAKDPVFIVEVVTTNKEAQMATLVELEAVGFNVRIKK